MEFVFYGISVGFPWNALISSTTFYKDKLDEDVSVAQLEGNLTMAYLGLNLLAFAIIHRPGSSSSSSSQVSSENEEKFAFRTIRAFFWGNIFGFSLLACYPWILEGFVPLYILVLVVGSALGISSAYYQSAMFGFSAREGKTSQFILGFALAGLLASVFALFTRTIASPQFTALLNFGMTVVSLIVGLALYSRHHTTGNQIMAVEGLLETTHVTHERRDDFKALYLLLTVLALSMAGTLAVFPALVSAMRPLRTQQDAHEFTSILFVLFNLGDVVGRGTADALLSCCNESTLIFLSLVRSIPLVLCFYCNRSEMVDEKQDDAWMEDSFVYGLIFFLGLSGGWLFGVAAGRAPSKLLSDQARAGNLVALVIACSLAIGAGIGTVVTHLVV